MSKATAPFKKVIQDYLQARGEQDSLFAETLKKEGKNIDDCVTYILNTVQNSGQQGFTDAEVFGMAVHYYDENDIKVEQPIANARVVVNHTVELTAEEKAEARKKALDKAIAEEQARMAKKPVKKAPQPTTPTQSSLF